MPVKSFELNNQALPELPVKRIVVLTGAGISAESGVKTFRDSDGLWENHRIEDVATPQAFARDPQLVQHFYNLRRRQLQQVEPNPAHTALAHFEQQFSALPGHQFLLVTQNVDNLHDRAGSQKLLHMHGELTRARCTESGAAQAQYDDITSDSRCQCCQLSYNSLRPDIVWFGEMPLHMDTIYQALEQCELFISIGTSGHVYPAAGFVEVARAHGAHCVEINPHASQTHHLFHHHIVSKAGVAVPHYCHALLGHSVLSN